MPFLNCAKKPSGYRERVRASASSAAFIPYSSSSALIVSVSVMARSQSAAAEAHCEESKMRTLYLASSVSAYCRACCKSSATGEPESSSQ